MANITALRREHCHSPEGRAWRMWDRKSSESLWLGNISRMAKPLEAAGGSFDGPLKTFKICHGQSPKVIQP